MFTFSKWVRNSQAEAWRCWKDSNVKSPWQKRSVARSPEEVLSLRNEVHYAIFLHRPSNPDLSLQCQFILVSRVSISSCYSRGIGSLQEPASSVSSPDAPSQRAEKACRRNRSSRGLTSKTQREHSSHALNPESCLELHLFCVDSVS